MSRPASRVTRLALVMLAASFAGCPAADEREAGFRRAAAERGMAFLGDLPTSAGAAIRAQPGPAGRAGNVFPRVLASEDRLIFDWISRDRVPGERDREAQTVFAFRWPGADGPSFVWTDPGALGGTEEERLGGVLDFPEDPVFGDAHDVAGPDHPALRALFGPVARAGLRRPDGVRVEGGGAWLMAYRPGRLVPARDLATELDAFAQALAPWIEDGAAP